MQSYFKLKMRQESAPEKPGDHGQDEFQSMSLFQTWWKKSAWPGMGLLGESYLLFSIGLIKPFWQLLYPECFSHESCSRQLLSSLTYSVVVGVILGMLSVGYLANSIGRRKGGITTALLMCIGSTGLTLVSFIFSNDPQLLFRCSSILLFIFGIGVGGEYPISSSTATERAMEEMKNRLNHEVSLTPSFNEGIYVRHIDVLPSCDRKEGKFHSNVSRGQGVQLVFLSQGIGILVNSCFIVCLLLIFRQYGQQASEGKYDRSALLSIWRIVYSVGTALLVTVLATRLAYLQESITWSEDKERRLKHEAFRSAAITAKSSSPSQSCRFVDVSSASTAMQLDINETTSYNRKFTDICKFHMSIFS
jgi:MFS family permease